MLERKQSCKPTAKAFPDMRCMYIQVYLRLLPLYHMFPLRLMLHTLFSKYVIPPLTTLWLEQPRRAHMALLAHQSSCFKLFLKFLASKKALKTALPLWREKRLSWLDTITKCDIYGTPFFFCLGEVWYLKNLRRYKVAIIIYTSCIPWTGLLWKTPWSFNPSCNKTWWKLLQTSTDRQWTAEIF